jgi:hypothetical protein
MTINTEIREITSAELDEVAGGLPPWIHLPQMLDDLGVFDSVWDHIPNPL